MIKGLMKLVAKVANRINLHPIIGQNVSCIQFPVHCKPSKERESGNIHLMPVKFVGSIEFSEETIIPKHRALFIGVESPRIIKVISPSSNDTKIGSRQGPSGINNNVFQGSLHTKTRVNDNGIMSGGKWQARRPRIKP